MNGTHSVQNDQIFVFSFWKRGDIFWNYLYIIFFKITSKVQKWPSKVSKIDLQL